MTVPIPINPDNILPVFIDILYSRRREITSANLSAFYESPILTRTFRYFISRAVTAANVLSFLRQFLALGLEDDATSLAPLIAPQFLSILRATGSAPFSLTDLYKQVSPRVFAEILKDPQLAPNVSQLTDGDKVRLTDEFGSWKPQLSDADREALAGVVSWIETGSFIHLVRHKCDWVPSVHTRSLYSQILSNRRSALSRFEKELQGSGPFISRWYPFAWLQLISDARVRKVSPTVSLISLVSTLGGMAKSLDPCVRKTVLSFKRISGREVFYGTRPRISQSDDWN
jgi:hypothetical protein